MNNYLYISTEKQQLAFYQDNKLDFIMDVSTGQNGTGQDLNSGKTPQGWHQIIEKFGECAPANTVFIGRAATGEIFKPSMKQSMPERDWILTRILRLKGLEPDLNLGGNVDTYERYIYLHGTPDDTKLGTIGSKGCIRMHNQDIIKLFNLTTIGTPVYIQ